jgi:hypothetical protein
MLIIKGQPILKDYSKKRTARKNITTTGCEKSIEKHLQEWLDKKKLEVVVPDKPTIVWDGDDSDVGIYYRKL